MGIVDIIKLMPVFAQVFSLFRKISEAIKAGQPVYQVIKTEAPALFALFEALGSALFPGLIGDPAASAGAYALDEEYVKKLQAALNALDPALGLTVDGVYGEKTREAVKAFQTKHGLDVDGWAGNNTRKKLKELGHEV